MIFKTAIIDRGIEAGHKRLQQCSISGVTIAHNGNGYIYKNEGFDTDMDGHGTAIAGIVHQAVPDMELVSVKLSSPDYRITEDHLCAGIAWCIEQPLIKIINISLGIATNEPSGELAQLCEQAHKRGKVITAAIHNLPYEECYPAFFPTVFGVACGLLKSNNEYSYLGEGKLNILARGTTQRVAWKGNSFKIVSGTSFATAHFTSILSHIIRDSSEILSIEKLKQKIEANSTNNIPRLNFIKNEPDMYTVGRSAEIYDAEQIAALFCGKKRYPSAKNLALFPICDKEMSTILNFEQMSQFRFTCFIDYPNSLFGRNGQALFDKDRVNIIRRELNENDFQQFDTLVVGYFLDKPFDANIIFGYNIIEQCLRLNKNIITWDLDVHTFIQQRIDTQFPGYTGNVFLINAGDDQYRKIRSKPATVKVKTPILAVIGTGNKQGKITTQMVVRKHLEAVGYKVSHISTEPQGALLNADFVFPFGYKSTVQIPFEKWGDFINQVTKGIQEYNKPDVLITGIQGSLLPHGAQFLNNDTCSSLASLNYLLAIKPDAVICTISPNDDPKDILQTSIVAKLYLGCETIFYVMTPIYNEFKKNKTGGVIVHNKILNSIEISAKLQEFQQAFKVPVFNITDQSNSDHIIELIQNAFS